METKRIRVGSLFLPSQFDNVMDNFLARMTARDEYHASERERMEPVKADILKALEALFQGVLTDIKLTWSPKAGCTMCPCSPGFAVSGIPTGKYSELLTPAWRGFPTDTRTVFYVGANRTIDVRLNEEKWGRRGRRREYTARKVCTLLMRGWKKPEVKASAA